MICDAAPSAESLEQRFLGRMQHTRSIPQMRGFSYSLVDRGIQRDDTTDQCAASCSQFLPVVIRLQCLGQSRRNALANVRQSSSQASARITEIGQRVHQRRGKDADADFAHAPHRVHENVLRIRDNAREDDRGRITRERGPVPSEVR
jgi:hypothetical protein